MKIVRKEIILPNETDLICWWKGREKRKGRQSAIEILSHLITSTTIPFVNVYATNTFLFILLFLKRPLKSHLARPRPSVLTASLLSANWPLAHLFRPHTTSSSPFNYPLHATFFTPQPHRKLKALWYFGWCCSFYWWHDPSENIAGAA